MSASNPRIIYTPAKGRVGARTNLTRFVRLKAQETADDLGFTWVGTPSAPSTYQQLRGAFEHSRSTGQPLPVSNEFCENTVYLEPADNVAFRFWHDTSHCRLGLSFQLADEWELSLWHLEQMEAVGLGPGTREYDLFRHDAIGQIILLAVAGRFPFRQGDFVRTCTELGLDSGILAELRRVGS